MVKHTQTIRRLLPLNCLSVFEHFVGLALKRLRPCQRSMMDHFAKNVNGFLLLTIFVKSSMGEDW